MPDVIVIGAGMAGVAAAHDLARAGLSVVVVEGRDRVGGRVHSVRGFCAQPLEAGAEFIHGVRAEHWDVARAAGVRTRPSPTMRGAMFEVGDGPRWLPLVLLHPAVWPTFRILGLIRKQQPPDVSARQFIERHGFWGRGRVLAEMTLTAHLPGSIDEVGILGLVEDQVLTLERGLNHRVVEGYDTLPRFLARDLDVRLGFDVETVRWSADAVAVTSRDGQELTARAAISTLPVGVLAADRVRFIPELPVSKREALRHVKMGPVVKVLLRFREPFWPRWMRTLICGVGPVTLYWAVFRDLDASPPPVLIAYATGPRAARLSAVSEGEATHIVLADLCHLFPQADPRSQVEECRRVDWCTDPFALGGYTFVLPGGTGARRRLAAADTGALFWAGAATATTTIADAVQGAYVSGRRAAAEAQGLLAGGP